jgi:hypothetical protein
MNWKMRDDGSRIAYDGHGPRQPGGRWGRSQMTIPPKWILWAKIAAPPKWILRAKKPPPYWMRFTKATLNTMPGYGHIGGERKRE